MKKPILMTVLAMIVAVYLGCGGDDNPINPPDDDDNPPPANVLRINEVLYSTSQDQIEIKNFGTSSVNVSSYWVCSLFSYAQMNDLNIISGSLNIPPGGIVAVSGFPLNNSVADLGLYETNTFGSASAMQDFVQWGSGGNGRESVAVGKGLWTAGDFISTAPEGHSIAFDGQGRTSSDWANQSNPTIGAEN